MTPIKPEISEFESLNIQSLIQRYCDASTKLNSINLDISKESLNKKFSNIENVGSLSCLELIGHIADAEIAVTHRMRRIIAEQNPTLAIWDENEFFKSGLYESNSPKEFLEVIRVIRNFTGRWLFSLNENQFSRTAIHPERGEITLKSILVYITWHLEQHAWFLRRKIEVLVKMKTK